MKFKAWLRNYLRSLARRILANVKPIEDEIDTALKHGFVKAGLNIDDYDMDFDLRSRRKFHDVLLYAADEVGMKLVTVGDLKTLFK